jgi:hypothetical protein
VKTHKKRNENNYEIEFSIYPISKNKIEKGFKIKEVKLVRPANQVK